MAEVPDRISKILDKFLENLKSSNIHLERAYLFGSYSKNSANADSDIDVALVSENFTGNPITDSDLIRRAKLSASFDIEAHTFKTDEFDDSNPFVREILRHGIPLV